MLADISMDLAFFESMLVTLAVQILPVRDLLHLSVKTMFCKLLVEFGRQYIRLELEGKRLLGNKRKLLWRN